MKEPEKNIRVHPDFEDKESFEEGVDKMYNQQSMRERFDGKFRNSATSTYRNNKLYAFIEKEIQLALKEQREETVEMVRREQKEWELDSIFADIDVKEALTRIITKIK